MRGLDAFAGVIKSGGKTRRAAKMAIMNADHPDIVDFIECKSKEEAKAFTLIKAGYDGSGPDSEAYSSIFFQNANNSVRVSDEFMRAYENDEEYSTYTVKGHEPVDSYKARDIMRKIAEATWLCGDPGLQFDSTINRWHTSKNSGRINASNPCSEYMFLDNSACNLASFNLMKYVSPSGVFDIPAYRHSISVVITAMEILVDNSGYPTESIARNSHDYRPLGLGYANLGALLMAFGLPYDSTAGRDLAAAFTAILTGQAYLQSSILAANCPPIASATPLTANVDLQGGACPGFYVNREPFLDVIRMHRAEVNKIGKSRQSGEPFVVPQLDSLIDASRECWDMALVYGERYGYRNSQTTVLAPTGTIGFMMDCDTTGIEPDLALVKYKKLVGGGMIKIVNNTVPSALFKLGYTSDEVNAIVSYIDATGTIEGAPGIKSEHLAVFDCSFKPSKGTRSIHYMGHIKMMAATQPFLSGAISKTVNLPQDASVEEVAEAYAESWRQGIKAVAIYRDGSKGTQPLNVSMDEAKREPSPLDAAGARILAQLAAGQVAAEADLKALEAKPQEKLTVEAKSILLAEAAFQRALQEIAKAAAVPTLQPSTALDATADSPAAQDPNGPPRAVRHRLQEERASITHKFSIAGHEGYVTVGLYPNGQPGEIFIKMAKEGSTISGLMDAFATSVSIALQHGVALKTLCEKFAHTRFEPSGWTGNPQIGYAKSLMDYIFRWLNLRFLSGTQLTLFAGFAPHTEQLPAPPSMIPESESEEDNAIAQGQLARIAEEVAKRLGQAGATAPAPQGKPLYDDGSSSGQSLADRGIFHAADAMKDMYEMGDAPSCSVCGAIMVRNGSCYRCMSCGSTSGCS
jgi:ribonucleoside-diphosphate reductase alpha chain